MDSPTTLVRIQRVLAAAMAILVLVLALMAGRSLFGTWDIVVHGYVGNSMFLLALVNLAVVLAARPTAAQFALAGMIALLVFAQIGLGYVGRDTAEAAALHIPNGVLLMGLTTYQFAELQARARRP